MKALIDSDILVYRIGFTTQDESEDVAKWRMDELLKSILERLSASDFQCYLTGSGDPTAYRKQVLPEYKANRKQPKPTHYQALREHLIQEFGASVTQTIEADDAIGIDNDLGNTIVVSIDKDLNQLPGVHYNFVKDIKYEVTEYEGNKFFYEQLLIGDTADNVKGVQGVGPVKAKRLLGEYRSEEDMFDIVRNAYNDDERMLRNGEALWILRRSFPEGRWCYSPLGGTLTQSPTVPSTLLSSLNICCTEYTQTEESGFLPSGISRGFTTEIIERVT